MSIAGVVITYNEERNIETCLRSLSFCDEIIVVDSGSHDRTIELASQFTEKVFTVPWKGYIDQKNTALTYTNCDWVVSIDADEEVPEFLQKEIQEVIRKAPEETSFYVPRKTYHSGRWIKHGGWYPNYLARVFQKNKGLWAGTELHEFWQTEGKEGYLKNDLIHYSFANISDQVARNNQYSELGAKALQKNGVQFSGVKLVLKPLSKFFETYFLKLGFLDGYPGFFISVSAAYSVLLKWAKLLELERAAKEA